MLIESDVEIFIEALEIVDAGVGVDFFGVRGDEGGFDFLASLLLLKVFIDDG